MNTRTKHRPNGLFVGLATVDISYTVDEIPRRDQKISVPVQHISSGGPANSAAITFAFLGGRASLLTAVGRHPVAQVIRDELDRFSIVLHDVARLRRELPPISSIMVLQATGERAVVSANAAVSSPITAEFKQQWLGRVAIVQVDGHYMPLCIAAARAARKRGIPVVLDSGSWKDGMDELLGLVDIAICSQDYRPPGCRDVSDVLKFLAAKKISKAAITRGSRPIRFVDGLQRGTIPVKKIRAVDTLGAGDIFHGAFCYYVLQPGLRFRDALAAAARVAAFSCQYAGTRSWMKEFPAGSVC